MISLKDNLEAIESLMILMAKYNVNDVSCDFLHLVRTPTPVKKELTEQEMLEKHLEPLPEEPWNSIAPDALEQFSRTGKI
jgi:hypothetical protein